MATILDELIVTLGLSSKGFDSGADSAKKKLEGIEGAGAKAAERTKKVGEESDSAAKGLGNLSTKMASFLALIGGTVAIKSFIKDTIETNTQLYFMSRNLDMSVQGLYALGAAAQELGIGKGSLQQLAAQLKQIPGQLLAGQTPTLLPLLARAGISFDQSPQQIMLGLARYFSTMPASVALGLGTSYGLSYDQMTFLLQGVQKVQSAFDRDKAFAPTTAQAKQFAGMKQQIADIGLAFTKLGYDLVSKAAPILEKVFGLLMRFAEWAQKHEQLVSSFLVALAVGIGAVSGAMGVLAAGAVALAPEVFAVVAAVSAFAGGIAYLYQTSPLFRKFLSDVADGFLGIGNAIDVAVDKLWDWAEATGKFTKRVASSNVTQKSEAFVAGTSTIFGSGKYEKASPEQIVSYLTSKGWSRGMAEGMAANIMAESSGVTNARGDNGLAYGLAQWHGARALAFRLAVGHSLMDAGWKEQLDFVDREARKMKIDVAKNVSARGGAANLSLYYEMPADAAGQAMKRANLAQSLFPSDSHISAINDHLRRAGTTSNQTSNSHTDNSITNNVGTVNIHGNGQSTPATPSAVRGMDWTTILMQSNYGLTG